MKALLRSAKFKITALILLITAIISTAVSGTIAFFTDSKESIGIYTAGNVYIEVTEAATVPDASGNLIENPSADRILGGEITGAGASVINDYGIVFPGQTIHKDPTIKNIGSNSAWVAAKVIIEDGAGDIHRLYAYNDEDDAIDIEHLLSGGLLDEHVHVGEWGGIDDVCYNDRYAMIQHSSRADGRYEFYFIMLQPLEKNASVELFDTFTLDPMFGNAEMQEFREFKITVQAFAVQTHGFDSCSSAMLGAFGEHFSGIAANP